jgi:hypothetical protein
MNRRSRPLLASAYLKQLSPRKMYGSSFLSVSTYKNTQQRDSSPALSNNSEYEARSRSNSVKRKHYDGPSYASILTNTVSSAPPTPVISNEVVEKVTTEVTKVKSLCEKVSSELGKIEIQPEIACLINDLCEAVSLVNSTQGLLVGAIKNCAPLATTNLVSDNSNNNNSMVSLGNITKKPRCALEPQLLPPSMNKETWIPATQQQQHHNNRVQVQEDCDPKLQQFKEAIKEAERSTLVFNLDMGKVPIMNRDTMSKKATESLTSMAANKEKLGKTIPSEESIAAIDDLLSVTTDMRFYGATTKTYRNPTDPKSGLYCTIPVRYEFRNKDDRLRAEKTLRDRCDVQCSTPYPPVVRECMKQIVSKVRQETNNDMVRINVDVTNMCFKISTRRRTGENEEKAKWLPYGSHLPIPASAVELCMSKKVPVDYKFEWPEAVMEVTETTPELPPGE